MKRIVVMSDIHGNLEALRAVAGSLPEYDALVVAGDHCLEGPHPAEVVDMLVDRGWSLLMGNTDRDIVEQPADQSPKKRAMVQWAREQLGPERMKVLADLPFSIRLDGDGETLLVVHANPLNLDQHLSPTMGEEELQPYLEAAQTDILAFGHLHTPYVRPVGGTLLIDVSSVGHPKDRDLRAAFTVLTWDGPRRTVEQVRVPYDVEKTVRAIRTSGMPEAGKEADALLRASY